VTRVAGGLVVDANVIRLTALGAALKGTRLPLDGKGVLGPAGTLPRQWRWIAAWGAAAISPRGVRALDSAELRQGRTLWLVAPMAPAARSSQRHRSPINKKQGGSLIWQLRYIRRL
jgi:hypothetical protein